MKDEQIILEELESKINELKQIINNYSKDGFIINNSNIENLIKSKMGMLCTLEWILNEDQNIKLNDFVNGNMDSIQNKIIEGVNFDK